ncbi:DUF6992 family protein [Brumimicrobium mesophilum]|uniref:DUF6992 family protein n=1 Tax=Brumimicrobium mesophilum TaxID=392717 RepID=UPI000D141DFE|nr:hypothetical protein [Brumimicrobium mesophilum]
MNNHLIIGFLMLIGFGFHGQSQIKTNLAFNKERQQINKSGMVALSSWAAANIAIGSIGWATAQAEAKYFHQMNAFWNIVNLGISVPGLFQSKKDEEKKISNGKLIQKQYSTEQIYLINEALNVVYIGSGILLSNVADQYPKNEQRFQGYGKSMIFQGSFLLVFDLIQFLRHRNHRLNSSTLFFDQVSLSNNGFGFKYSFK